MAKPTIFANGLSVRANKCLELAGMGIFSVHRRIVDDYASYIRSFVAIADDELCPQVGWHLAKGHLWPEPLLAFAPAFATGDGPERDAFQVSCWLPSK